VGKPWPRFPEADAEQIPGLHAGRHPNPEAGTVPPPRAKNERAGDCAHDEDAGPADERGTTAAFELGGRAFAPDANALWIFPRAGRARSGRLGGISERGRARTDERVGLDAAQARAFLPTEYSSLFNPSEANPGRVQPNERKVLNAGPGVRMELLAWGNTMMEPHLFRIAPSASSGESYAHEGEEFLYILRGTLEITLDNGETARLAEGDSFYFESSNAHHWKNPGKSETLVLWVNTPPTF
jgi:quercetin dioxygenase-like cupin family protein